MPDLPNRRSIRLKGYDYTREGAYYVTICTWDRRHLFGRVVDGVMHLSPIGQWAEQCWLAIPEHMPYVDIADFVIMPDHMHGIVVIRDRLVAPDPADHDRPEKPPTTNRPETDFGDHDRPEKPLHNEMGMTAAPGPQPRVDHDRPLPPPTPPANAERTMPIVPPGSLGHIVRAYKSAVTRNVYRAGLLPRGVVTPSLAEVWQRNYYEHIIRDEADWIGIADYIRDNLKNWKGDGFNG